MPAKQDPFYVVKGKVEKLVIVLKQDYGRWRDLLDNSDDGGGQFEELSKKLRMHLQTITVDLNDLQQTVGIVEKYRARFQDIDDDELGRRRKFINSMKMDMKEIEDALESPAASKMKQKSNREQLFNKPASKAGGYSSVPQSSQMMEVRQDEVLDDMSAVLGRLGEGAAAINLELGDQASALQEMDDEMDIAAGSMATVQKKMEKLLGTSDKGRLCCIFWLFGLCVLLFFLIIYT
eukprot:CAMPEP_0175095756 /NCGR_PEP_ID=MMETSP0086_2-20121207/4345_1 /TAXON_ID=136419 /ORGANISM="Unknown Unknown, Strain D1" /LENGTH=234 /DNA_ID=CAMNT_0016369065 /DNA_START=114 /DNA_END=818 /DNA_ORIENTATION=+